MDIDHPPENPLELFDAWFSDARGLTQPNPHAMALATASDDGVPSVRMVLMKGLDADGLVFYTNYDSPKGRDLQANPHAAAVLHWDEIERQVRIEGKVTKVSAEESDAYFATRPLGSQIGAWASPQSEPLKSRASLVVVAAKVAAKYLGRKVPRPPNWGGYRISLDRIEFWQGRASRLHDRIVYIADGDGGWHVQRLSP